MFRALLYLQVMTFRGRLISQLRRLRQPKYLVGAVIGIAYLYFVIFRNARFGSGYGPRNASSVPDTLLPLITDIAALGLLIVLAVSWLVPRARAGFSFSDAEIAFLFPAPVSRRTLIHYRLLSSQAALALTALILALLSSRRSLASSGVTHAIGWWLLLGTVNLHFTGSAFVITRLLDRGVTPLRRGLIGLAILILIIGGLFFWIASSVRAPEPGDLVDFRTVLRYLNEIFSSGPMYWLLAVPRMVITPFVARDVHSFLLALGPALLVFAAHYFWVLRSEVAFEEASLARAEKRAARLMAIKQGDWRANVNQRKGQRDPFKLSPIGRPEIAFLWKNLLATVPIFRVQYFLLAAAVIAIAFTWLHANIGYHPALYGVSGATIMTALTCAIFGPQLVRQDLRADLPRTDLLKTYPLAGWQVVLGEVLAPLVMLTSILWLLLLAAAFSFPPDRVAWLTPGLRVAIAAGLGVLAPPFIAVQLLVPNAAALLFPAWSQTVSNRAEQGLDVLGQRILFAVGQLLIVALALLPCALAATILFFAVRWLWGPYPAAIMALLGVIAILLAEFWAGLQWLGRRFEAFDLSSELRP
jgi:ABC-2 type transport system permease protein